MTDFIKRLVISKLQQITHKDLLYYGKEYGLHLDEAEAKEIIFFLKNEGIDPFNKNDRLKTFQKLAEVTSDDTANKALKLFDKIISSYGLEHLFE